MANVISANPLVLDSGSATAIFDAKQTKHIRRVKWDGPTTTTHTFSLQDAAGNVIVSDTCSVANQGGYYWVDHSYEGLLLAQISSGKLYVWFD